MKRDLGLIGLGAASALAYALIARAAGAAGFPLDDAWIHQTYARNLGWHGQWAFILGQPSAGSTAPLWTFLLAIGYTLRIDYAAWTLLLNAILLGLTSWLAFRLARQVGNVPHSAAWWAGALVVFEWHLVWAAASGMETVLFCALVLAAWVAAGGGLGEGVAGATVAGAHRGPSAPILSGTAVAGATRSTSFWAGVLGGLSVWARPDGLTLLPFLAWLVWDQSDQLLIGIRQRAQRLGWFAGGAALVLVPYFVFNLALSGQLWCHPPVLHRDCRPNSSRFPVK